MLALLILACFAGVALCDQSVQEPQCMFEENEAACCVKIGLNSFKHKICMKTVLDLEKTQGHIGLFVDGKTKHETELATGASCWPVESLPGVSQCINVYHLVLDTSRKVIESCALWNVGDLLQVRFACIKFEDGKLSHHNDIQPENYGIVTATAEDGGKLNWQIKVKKVLKKWWEKTWSSIKNYVKPKPKDDITKFISSK